MIDNKEIKNCPCCGGKAVINITSLPDSYSDHYQIECTNCGLSMPIWDYTEKDKIIKQWNRRENGGNK